MKDIEKDNKLSHAAVIMEGKKPIIFDCLKNDIEMCLNQIGRVNIIYIGEVHFTDMHYQAEIEIIQATSKKYKIQIAMEQFHGGRQEAIDEYLSGGRATEYLQESPQFPLLEYARKYNWKVIALDIPPEKREEKDGWDPEGVMTRREKYWAEILIPRLNAEIKTFVIVGSAHLRKYCGFPIVLARAGLENYINIELK